MNKIKELFDTYFEPSGITLPEEVLVTQQPGVIDQFAGWQILYVFGREDNQRYLEFYATHRMSNDLYRRIYESGEVVRFDGLAPEYSREKNRAIAARLPTFFKEELQRRGYPFD